MPNGTLTNNGSTDWITLEHGRGMISLSGNFGTGVAQLEVENESGGADEVTDGAFSAATVAAIDLIAQVRVRLTLAGATTPSLVWEIRSQRGA